MTNTVWAACFRPGNTIPLLISFIDGVEVLVAYGDRIGIYDCSTGNCVKTLRGISCNS